MKPSSSVIEGDEEGSTLDAQQDDLQQQQQQQQQQHAFTNLAEQQQQQQQQQQHPVETILSSSSITEGPKMSPATDSNINNNLNASNYQQQNNKQQAWFQRVVHHRAETYIEAQVLQLTEECRLFRDDDDDDDDDGPENQDDNSKCNLALFRRDEIQTSWRMLGSGAYSEVYAIQHINLTDTGFVDVQQQEARTAIQSSIQQHQQQQQQQRPQLPLLSLPSRSFFLGGPFSTPSQPAVSSSSSLVGTGRYVIKHLRRDLLKDRRRFIHAAGDLILEAMYLSKLNHPNIISLRGCAVGGPTAYSDGKHDGFFLILDRVDMTLSQQICEWERSHNNNNNNHSSRSSIGRPQQQQQQQKQQQLPSLSSLQPSAGGGTTTTTTTTSSSSPCIVYSKDLIDFEERIDIAHQVGRALEYLHSRDIIFRDLKPDNIGLIHRPGSKPPLVQLFDFGLCRELPEASPEERTVFHMSGVGTRRYMAPEVFLGHHYNVKADVYSWTMILHAMLSLQRPFEMYDVKFYEQMVCQGGLRPTIYRDWPTPIQDVLRDGWAAHPHDRPRMDQICTTLSGMLQEIDTIKAETVPTNSSGSSTTAAAPSDTFGPQQSTNSSPPCSNHDDGVEDHEWHESSGCGSTSSSTVKEAFESLIDSWTSTLCVGEMYGNKNKKNAATASPGRRSPLNLLRALEAHLVADAAGSHLLLRERIGTAEYPPLIHLRSSYL